MSKTQHIERLAKAGKTIQEIAFTCSTTTGSVRATLYRLRKNGRNVPAFRSGDNVSEIIVPTRLSKVVADALHEQAQKRGMSTPELMSMLATATALDELVDGILDDGDD